MTAAAQPTVTVTLGAFTLPEFSAVVTIDGIAVTIPVPATKIAAGVTGTFVMPQATATVSFLTADSKSTIDTTQATS